MDFTQTRCAVCSKYFCCVSHRSAHQVKCVSDRFIRRHTNYLVNTFQKRAETLIITTQNRQKIKKNTNQFQVAKASSIHQQPKTNKRLHGEINNLCTVQSRTSVTVLSQTRKYLVPIHRLKLYTASKNYDKESIEKADSEICKDSTHGNRAVKTSTPLADEKYSQVMWNVSSESTISNYHTPSGPSPDLKNEYKSLIKLRKQQTMTTPLQGIIYKYSKYDNESDSGPSQVINNSKGHRVRFSFSSSQISRSSSLLESVQEVDICKENYDNDHHDEVMESKTKIRKISTKIEDSTFQQPEAGFFSCMSNMLCSAIHTIPAFAYWRKTETDSVSNKSKPICGPIAKGTHCQDFETPLHKQPCYQCDLRYNPIRSRKPISKN